MFNTETYTLRKAHTAASIITHAKSKAVKQAHIRTSNLLSYNYYNRVRATQICHLLSHQRNYSRTETQKSNSWELRTRPALYYPSISTESSKQHNGLNTYPNKLGRNANRLHKGDVLAHLTSFKQASKSSTKRSFLARGFQRYHSYLNRSCLPSAIEEDKRPKQHKAGKQYEVKPQYEELSKQLIKQHTIINAMKCMRAIKDRIARPVYQLAIIQSASIPTRCINQISPGTANLKPSLTGHDNSAAKQLKHNFKTEENTYPKAYTDRGTLGQDFTESVERTGSSRFLKSMVPVSKLISIVRETQEEFSATNITQNHGGKQRKSTEKGHGEQ
ncbi:putative serine/threonine-protein kinase NAK [Dorcoceras hygrometricum]|uniref:Putative serine/threonine-protein kinase NAK n=1 Tax=Dorcoceras hygrometricum TaxID=472368 RepID=A0A2Z7BGJ6_9LAMI|nr:putative serine/threonine-protein kinase NAK [Dorcoceras hygrometricum]